MTRAVTWTLGSGSHVLCSGGMSKNNKDDRVSKKNNYTQQILYDHLNLAERTGLAANLFHSFPPGGSFDARHFRRLPYTFATRRILTDINSPHASSQAWLNLHASFDSSTHSFLYAPEQPDHCRRGMGEGEGREGVVGRAGSHVLEIEIIINALFIVVCIIINGLNGPRSGVTSH
jgi:hypothetical protein